MSGQRPRRNAFDSQIPVTFFLVHGTWAPNATWVAPDSPLCRRLRAEFPSCQIEVVRWSGNNRFSDRLATARELERRALQHVDLGGPVFLVGHSHGGSVIAYALKGCSRLSNSIGGALFLGTPFFALEVRRGYRLLVQGAAVLVMSVLFVAAALGLSYLVASKSWTDVLWRDWLALGLAVTVGFGCLAMARALRRGKWIEAQWQAVQNQVRELETTSLDDVPMLFLRTTGDEVAMVMGFLQLLCFISNTVAALSVWAVEHIVRLFSWVWRRTWGKIVLCGVGLCAVLGIAIAGAIGKSLGFPLQNGLDMFNPFSTGWGLESDVRFTPMGLAEIVYRAGLFAVDLVAAIFLLLAAVLSVAISAATLTSTVTYWAFGRFHPLQALALEMAAEPTPRGERSFFHLPWDEHLRTRAAGGFGLRHSEPYTEPPALEAVSAWVRGEFAGIDERARNWDRADRG